MIGIGLMKSCWIYLLVPILAVSSGCGRNNNGVLTLVVSPADDRLPQEAVELSSTKARQKEAVLSTVQRVFRIKPETRTASVGLHMVGPVGIADAPKYFIQHTEGQTYVLIGDASSNSVCAGPTADYNYLVEHAGNRMLHDIGDINEMTRIPR